MLKYEVGQEFKTNRVTKFPNGYGEDLPKGATFKITYTLEEDEHGKLEHPYLVRFENGYEIAINDENIEELTKEVI